MLPPNEELKLKDSLGNLPFSISAEMLNEKNVKYFDVIQDCDETLFVPSKWFHQVRNIDDSVSVNHNWFNACNIHIIVNNLLQHHKDVEKEIFDCRDMENYVEHCQLILKSSFGMNFYDLVQLLLHIAEKRIESLTPRKHEKFDEFLFDLEVIFEVLESLKEKSVINNLDDTNKLISEAVNKIKKLNIF